MDIQKFKCDGCDKDSKIVSCKNTFDSKYRCGDCWSAVEGIPRKFPCQSCGENANVLRNNNLTEGKFICEKCF